MKSKLIQILSIAFLYTMCVTSYASPYCIKTEHNSFFCKVPPLPEPPNKTYQIKYIEEKENGETYCYPQEFQVKVTRDRITYITKNKYWNCRYDGMIDRHGKKITSKADPHEIYFFCYTLTTSGVKLYVSESKCVKYNGVFYYMLIFDGQVNYAL